ncbi:MAG: hypothetical protein DCO96_12035 [Fluviicola sp. XM-24bin1]|nr:MAG: hypothetical protein DCO96_12035 [Fluviicola sp. XM-24bin1]
MKQFLVLILLSINSIGFSQDSLDSVPYNSYRNKIVLYSDLGFSSAPFTIRSDFDNNVNSLKYRHNQRLIMGLGFAYKWAALRIGFGLPVLLRPVSRFGPSNYLDLGFKFNFRQTFWDFDFRNYNGYVLKDAYQWNDTLNSLSPNAKMPRTRSTSFSVNTWYFRSKDFRMNSVLGKVGDYNKSHGTWYFKGTLNLFGSTNDEGGLLPVGLVDTTQNINRVSTITALDIGIVPGYAYVYRWENWQAAGFGGLGGVLQSKFFAAEGQGRGFLGLAPRLDLRFIIGYSKAKYFLWLHTNFDVKSIRFRDLSYQQTYNTIRLIAGMRLDKREKKKE